MDKRKLSIIGTNELVSIGTKFLNVPAKIDTGADSSAIWASNIKVTKDGVLKFSLFGEGSKYYTGKIFKRTDYKVACVRSSNGGIQIRYRTHFTVKVKGKKIRILFNLSDRSRNAFPILLGRRSLHNKFIVDVSKSKIKPKKVFDVQTLNAKLKEDPYKFHKKYVINNNLEEFK